MVATLQRPKSDIDKQVSKPSLKEYKKDSRYILIGDLPSDYKVYKFNELYIRTFTVDELELIAMSIATKNEEYIINAVANCINVDVNDLTLGDFEFIIYWLRMNSYPKTPLIITWVCGHCEHKNLSRVNKANLIINSVMDSLTIPENTTFPIMRDYMDMIQAKDNNPALADIIDISMWVTGESLEDKRKILKACPDLSLYEECRSLASSAGEHGVSEYVVATCDGAIDGKECGAESKLHFTVQLLTFFP